MQISFIISLPCKSVWQGVAPGSHFKQFLSTQQHSLSCQSNLMIFTKIFTNFNPLYNQFCPTPWLELTLILHMNNINLTVSTLIVHESLKSLKTCQKCLLWEKKAFFFLFIEFYPAVLLSYSHHYALYSSILGVKIHYWQHIKYIIFI